MNRIAEALEAIVALMTQTANDNTDTNRLMEQMATNQARMVEQNDEAAKRSAVADIEAKKHRESCEEWHRGWLDRVATLERRLAELERPEEWR